MLPGSAQTVRDLSGGGVDAKLAPRQASKVPRRAIHTVLLFIADLRNRVLTKAPAVFGETRACEEGFNCGGLAGNPRRCRKTRRLSPPGFFAKHSCLHATHPEGVQRPALRNRRQIGGLGHCRRADGAELVVEIE